MIGTVNSSYRLAARPAEGWPARHVSRNLGSAVVRLLSWTASLLPVALPAALAYLLVS